MAKKENQKLKLFRILEILMRCTDEEEGITMPELISALSDYGIEAERKSIYRDFEALEEIGFSVIKLSTSPVSYTLDNRVFELAELKLLVDAVGSSKFITDEKSRQIVKKLKLFAGKRGAERLSRQVYFEDRIKTESREVLYAVDAIHKCINEGKRLSFGYFDYTAEKEKVLRHGGERYSVSPKALVWSEENYYLVGYDEREGIIKNFRVDKMHRTEATSEAQSESALRCKINPADYSNKIFGMYGGREELVTLEVKDRLSGAIIDRFGKTPHFTKCDFGFRVALRVMVSPTFFAWVMSFGSDMRIVSPASVKDEMLCTLEKILENYK